MGWQEHGDGRVPAAAQTVDVSAAGASIDAGRATANLSAYLGGALAYKDRITARADFLDTGGAALGSVEIGPVTAEDRRGLTTMLRRRRLHRPGASGSPRTAGRL